MLAGEQHFWRRNLEEALTYLEEQERFQELPGRQKKRRSTKSEYTYIPGTI